MSVAAISINSAAAFRDNLGILNCSFNFGAGGKSIHLFSGQNVRVENDATLLVQTEARDIHLYNPNLQCQTTVKKEE